MSTLVGSLGDGCSSHQQWRCDQVRMNVYMSCWNDQRHASMGITIMVFACDCRCLLLCDVTVVVLFLWRLCSPVAIGIVLFTVCLPHFIVG